MDYQSPGIPATFLIDRTGIIRERVLGAADWNASERREMIEKLLASGK
jgi:peroxiredoxin